MDAQRLIARLRDGYVPSASDLAGFARGLADGTVGDAQAGAFAMAVCLRGLGDAGRTALTAAMRDSGEVLQWDLPGPVVDKHSTGGVGDCVSLILAPALAACGAYVPMISGRGLGHTGGTLDKLESIPGYRTDVPRDDLDRVLRDVGCAIVGATDQIAPADRRLYAIRDVTGTVESLDLITASILSKKLAAGLDALVLDVKCGSGAFMTTKTEARALAEALVTTANAAGCRSSALITDMDSPLAGTAGNALEVREVIGVMTHACNAADGQDASDTAASPLQEVTVALGGEALALCGLAATPAEGEAQITRALTSGRALERFARMVTALGGPADLVEAPDRYLPVAQEAGRDEPSGGKGAYVAAIDTRRIGELVVDMGGGRKQLGDSIDHSVGFELLQRKGAWIDDVRSVGQTRAHSLDEAERWFNAVQAAYTLSPDPVEPDPLIIARIPAPER